MITVKLNAREIVMGACVGIFRRFEKLLGLCGDRAQNMQSSWDNEINGAIAELGWCKHWGVYWTGVSGKGYPDTPKGEVRWTHHQGRGGLPWYNRDKPKSPYVLADGYPPVINYIGWLYGHEAAELTVKINNIDVVPRDQLRKFEVIDDSDPENPQGA